MLSRSVRPKRATSGPLRAWAVALTLAAALPGLLQAAEQSVAVEQRLSEAARYLSSDELQGRGIGTKGLELAAQYIAVQFNEVGLKTDVFEQSPFQPFEVSTGTKLGAENRLTLLSPPAQKGGEPNRIDLTLGQQFTPLAVSGSGRFDLPLVFVGYGITGKEEAYDDYAGVDVKQKAVVILRHEPQQADPKSVFNGTNVSQYAPFRRKVSNAIEHEAAAVIFCTDRFEIRRNAGQVHKRWQAALDRLAQEHAKLKKVDSPTLEQIESQRQRMEELAQEVDTWSKKLQDAQDPMLPFTAGGRDAQQPDLPVLFCRRGPLDRALKAASGNDLGTLEEQIDQELEPQSRLLPDWRAVGQVDVQRTTAEVKNVIAVLEGAGPLADETLVIGAHYDHLGFGRGSEKTLYNGADDNASGVAVMLEVARRLASRPEKLRRRVVFIAFAAEERGLLGSHHYVRNPRFPIENTIAMLNADCVGRLREEKLTVGGVGSAAGFDPLLDELNQRHAFKLTKQASGRGPSDHAAFYGARVPVMHLFTGRHGDLHRPSDDFETLNLSGMRRIADLVTELAVALANADGRPEYVAVGSQPARS